MDPNERGPASSSKNIASTQRTSNNNRHLLKFYPLVCTLDFGFWREVNSAKFIKWRLETPCVPIRGSLVPLPPSNESLVNITDKRSDHTISFGWRLHLDYDAFDTDTNEDDSYLGQDSSASNVSQNESPSSPLFLSSLAQSLHVRGLFFNANSADDFRKIDRQHFIHQLLRPILTTLTNARQLLLQTQFDPTYSPSPPSLLQCNSPSNNLISHLTSFLVLSFADLRSHLYYYNVALPALRPLRDITCKMEETCSSSLPFSLTHTHLAILAGCLLGTTTSNSAGFFGCCILIRRLISDDTGCSKDTSNSCEEFTPDPVNEDWLLEFWNAEYSHIRYHVDQNTILMPLWNVLLKCHQRYSVSSVKSNFCLTTPYTEGFVCVIDSIKSDRDTLGWPLRSLLFTLGYLGFSNTRLHLILFRDGPSGVQTLQQFSSERRLLTNLATVGMTIDMPATNCFVLNADQKAVEAELNRETCRISESPQESTLSSSTYENRSPSQPARDPVVPGWLRLLVPKNQHQQQHLSSLSLQQYSITFLVDLRHHLDPMISQADAVYLNVRLIKWRILPTLDISKLQSLRFLLFGVGTLGCNILRTLVAWGIRQFTLIDNGYVALSSPVRQSLFTHEDAVWNNGKGKSKVLAAKSGLLEIRPDLQINAIQMDIPMPGHPRYLLPSPLEAESISPSSHQKYLGASPLHQTVELLERLIDVHDVILLLTDSRESRWLPSMLVSTRPFRGNSNLISSPSSHVDVSSGTVVVSPRVKPPPPLPITHHEINNDTCRTKPLINSSSICANYHSTDAASDIDLWNRLFVTRPTFPSPLCITVALGFDSFVVMRHGQRSLIRASNEYQSSSSVVSGDVLKEKSNNEDTDKRVATDYPLVAASPEASPLLACYFCNDLTAPADSLARRPLDQQCTVTRPGMSGLASGIAAELIAAISQHPEAPNPPHSAIDFGPQDRTHSCLGATPHTIRGSLGDFRLICTETEAFNHCISCSIPIAQKYCSSEKFNFIAEAITRSDMLEEISGLAAMKGCHREDEVFMFDDLDMEE